MKLLIVELPFDGVSPGLPDDVCRPMQNCSAISKAPVALPTGNQAFRPRNARKDIQVI
jgi:hypothetical protein